MRHVAGTDVGFERGSGITRAAVAVLFFPGLELVDYAHPRRFGIACHMGVTCGIPSIGVAKSRLIGGHGQPMQRRGAWVPLKDQGETIGAVLRSRAHAQPVYVSIGHRVSPPLAVRYVMACTAQFRLPETTRWAHRLASGDEPAASHNRC